MGTLPETPDFNTFQGESEARRNEDATYSSHDDCGTEKPLLEQVTSYQGEEYVVRLIVGVFKDLMAHLTEQSSQRIEQYRTELQSDFPLRMALLTERNELDFPTCLPDTDEEERMHFQDLEDSCRKFTAVHKLTPFLVSQVALFRKQMRSISTGVTTTPHGTLKRNTLSIIDQHHQQQDSLQRSKAGKRSRADIEMVPSPEIAIRESLLGTASMTRATPFSPDPKGTPGFHSLCRRFEELGKRNLGFGTRKLPLSCMRNVDSEETPIRVKPVLALDTPAAFCSQSQTDQKPVDVHHGGIFDKEGNRTSLLSFGQSPAMPRSGYVMSLVESFERGGTPILQNGNSFSAKPPWKLLQPGVKKPNLPAPPSQTATNTVNAIANQWCTPHRQQQLQQQIPENSTVPPASNTNANAFCEEKKKVGLEQNNNIHENLTNVTISKSPPNPSTISNNTLPNNNKGNNNFVSCNAVTFVAETPVPMKRAGLVADTSQENWDDLRQQQEDSGGSAATKTASIEIVIPETAEYKRSEINEDHDEENNIHTECNLQNVVENVTLAPTLIETTSKNRTAVPLLPLAQLTTARAARPDIKRGRPLSCEIAPSATSRLMDLGLPAQFRAKNEVLMLNHPEYRQEASKINWDTGLVIPVKYRGEDRVFPAAQFNSIRGDVGEPPSSTGSSPSHKPAVTLPQERQLPALKLLVHNGIRSPLHTTIESECEEDEEQREEEEEDEEEEEVEDEEEEELEDEEQEVEDEEEGEEREEEEEEEEEEDEEEEEGQLIEEEKPAAQDEPEDGEVLETEMENTEGEQHKEVGQGGEISDGDFDHEYEQAENVDHNGTPVDNIKKEDKMAEQVNGDVLKKNGSEPKETKSPMSNFQTESPIESSVVLQAEGEDEEELAVSQTLIRRETPCPILILNETRNDDNDDNHSTTRVRASLCDTESNPPSSDLIVSSSRICTLSSHQQNLGAPLLRTSSSQCSPGSAEGGEDCIKRLTPRVEVCKEDRRHRILKPVGAKDINDQADLSDEEARSSWKGKPPKKHASWAKDTQMWHTMVRDQSNIDPLSIFGCGVRPAMFEEIFQTPDFQRAARDFAQRDGHARHKVPELMSQEARNMKARKWYQDQKICGFRAHEGVSREEVAKFRKRVGRLKDVSSLVWDARWTACDSSCDHDSSIRQPWFQKSVASAGRGTAEDPSPCPVSMTYGESPGGRFISRRFMSPLPLSRARELPDVKEEDELEEDKGPPKEECEMKQAPDGYFRGIFFTTGPSPPPSTLSASRLPTKASWNTHLADSYNNQSCNKTSASKLPIPTAFKSAHTFSSNIPSPFTGGPSSSTSTPHRQQKTGDGGSRRVFRPVPRTARDEHSSGASRPMGATVSLFAKLRGK